MPDYNSLTKKFSFVFSKYSFTKTMIDIRISNNFNINTSFLSFKILKTLFFFFVKTY